MLVVETGQDQEMSAMREVILGIGDTTTMAIMVGGGAEVLTAIEIEKGLASETGSYIAANLSVPRKVEQRSSFFPGPWNYLRTLLSNLEVSVTNVGFYAFIGVFTWILELYLLAIARREGGWIRFLYT